MILINDKTQERGDYIKDYNLSGNTLMFNGKIWPEKNLGRARQGVLPGKFIARRAGRDFIDLW